MGAIFGKSKRNSGKVSSADMAVLQLKQQRDKLGQYQRRLEIKLEREKAVAKEYLQKGQKERALNILKRKKLIENYIVNTDSLLEHLESQLHSITFSQVQSKVLDGLAKSNEVLKQLNQILSTDRVESILDEAREGAEHQKEIDEMIKGALTDEDESDLMEELEKLQSENVAIRKKQPLPDKIEEEKEDEEEEEEVLELPKVPTHDSPTQSKENKKARIKIDVSS